MCETSIVQILVASIPAALAMIGGIVAAIVSAKGNSNQKKAVSKLDDMNEKIGKMREEQLEHQLSIWRLTIASEEMPMSERLIAGDKYVKAGGNGDVKHLYESLNAAVNNQLNK